MQWLDRTTVVCDDCKENKHIDEMTFRPKSGYSGYCKQCRQKKEQERNAGKEIPWSSRATKIKTRATKYGLGFSLTGEELESAWEAQDKLCAYTGDAMIALHGHRNHPQAVSVDRFDPSEGYHAHNIVLCSFRANTIKSNMTMDEFKLWLPSWYERGSKYVKGQ